MLLSRVALALVATLAMTGCASGADTAGQTSSDDELAERLRDNARSYDVARAQLAAEEERDRAALEDSSTPVDPAPGSSGAAGSSSADAERRAARQPALLTAADRASFIKLGRSLPGSEGVAVAMAGTGTQVFRAGSLKTGVAWSTSKVPVAMATIVRGVGSSADRERAITASDNAAAERLWAALGSGAAPATTRQLRAAGDRRTVIQGRRLRAGYTAFGQTAWALTDQARFAAGMTCTAAGRQTLTLMGQTVSSQRWGLGRLQGWRIKGGWGPGRTPGKDDGWLERQFGVVTIDGSRVAVAMATTASSHEVATANLTRIAQWVATNVSPRGMPSGC